MDVPSFLVLIPGRKRVLLLWTCCLIAAGLWSQSHILVDTVGERASLIVGRTPTDYFSRPGAAPFRVYAGELPPGRENTRPALTGSIERGDGFWIYTPAVPFRTGVQYWVVFADGKTRPFELEPADSSLQAEVLAIFPSADTLPANQRKLHVYFSRPMASGKAQDHIRLMEAGAGEVPEPFASLSPEPWDSARQRLTLWLDPDWEKRDEEELAAQGTTLREGAQYRLDITPGWPAEAGGRLVEPFSKSFFVGKPDREKPRVEDWGLELPPAQTKAPLRLRFGEPLDAVLLREAISLWHEQERVAGEIRLGERERSIAFVPERAWRAGDYQLRVEARLDDLARNNLRRVYDRDISLEDIDREAPVEFAVRTFSIDRE